MRSQEPISKESTSITKAPFEDSREAFEKKRREVLSVRGLGPRIEFAPGVSFECLVGGHNGARNISTGLVSFGPNGQIPYHLHTFTESITLIQGQVSVEIEGRHYRLKPLDNVTIPAGRAHQTTNLSNNQAALLHIALASDSPTRTLSEKLFKRRTMPSDSIGMPSAERVTRFSDSVKYSDGPQTEFVDYSNSNLMPGLEMSTGLVLIETGGRVLSHPHGFDESICVVQGSIECDVERGRYFLSDYGSVLVPGGCRHSFVNGSEASAAIIYTCASPIPTKPTGIRSAAPE